LAGLCSVVLIALLFLFSGESAQTGASEFMTALAKADAKGLAKRSVIHDQTEEQREKTWEETLKYSKTFMFHWALGASKDDGKKGAVKLDYTKNPFNPSSYPEHFELVLVKKDDGWKVDATQISRDMYPYLPQ
jgi:hypothetical protein